jgi:hypothetical protein
VGRVGSRWGRSKGAELDGENKKGGGGEYEGWSKFLNAPERPEQGD